VMPYKINNIELPSVTTITGDLIPKGDALIQWAANCAADFARESGDFENARFAWKTVKKEAAGIGTQAHDMIEWFIKDKGRSANVQKSDVAEVSNAFSAFMRWNEANIDIWLESEKPVFDLDNLYAGTLDAVAKLKTGKIAVIDFKTSKGFYSGFDLQVAAYGKAREKLKGRYKIGKRDGNFYEVEYEAIPKIDEYIILRIDKETGQPESKNYTKGIDRAYGAFLKGLDFWYELKNRRLKNNLRVEYLRTKYKGAK